MNGRFKIYLRKRQNQAEYPAGSGNNVNVTVQCNSLTGFAEYVPGNVDNAWYDYTDYIEGLEKLNITWDKVNSSNTNSETNQDGSNYDKGLTADLMFFDAAYYFIYDWLLTTECQILNAIEVKIVDLIAGGAYRIFEIKNDNIEEAPVDEPCQLTIKLREQDGVWHCVHKTVIWDNWQHWFEASATKTHPCFLTGIEPRPRIVNSVRMALHLFASSNPIATAFGGIFGSNFRERARRILGLVYFADAPQIQTYIRNVAMKCGLTTDTIFDTGQPWANLCLYYPSAGYFHESDQNAVASPNLYYNFENRWLITIADLLDKLKIVFAAEWYVTPNNTIVFKHTKDLIDLAPIYDFTTVGAQPIYDLRYTFNGDKKPAYGRYEYSTDGSDLASQEISTLYNDIVDYDGPSNNPMLEGERNKTNEFAPTGFIRDGRGPDYVEQIIDDGKLGAQALLVITIVLLAVFAPAPLVLPVAAFFFGLWETTLVTKAGNLETEFVDDAAKVYTGAVRLTSEQVLTPRLILWDGANLYRAKAVATTTLPTPNIYYNPPPSEPYNARNSIMNDNPAAIVYNYPLYYDSYYTGNLFDQYHDELDNPLKSKESHRDVKFNVDLCEDMLRLFGVFENQYIVIGKIVKIEAKDNYDVYARIGNIQVDYDENKINIKGKVLRR